MRANIALTKGPAWSLLATIANSEESTFQSPLILLVADRLEGLTCYTSSHGN